MAKAIRTQAVNAPVRKAAVKKSGTAKTNSALPKETDIFTLFFKLPIDRQINLATIFVSEVNKRLCEDMSRIEHEAQTTQTHLDTLNKEMHRSLYGTPVPVNMSQTPDEDVAHALRTTHY